MGEVQVASDQGLCYEFLKKATVGRSLLYHSYYIVNKDRSRPLWRMVDTYPSIILLYKAWEI
jgi:hypothetical protein